jgi:transposase
MNSRLFPICPEFFSEEIEPLIYAHYKRPGRPPQGSHYQFFCATLYVLRTGISWRDLPPCFGSWHTVYTRFKRWSENGLFWSLLYQLQQRKKVTIDLAWVDSTTILLHRHGSGPLKKEVNKP